MQPGQLALAWVLAQGEDAAPIPGTKRVTYLEENIGALDVALSEDDLAVMDRVRGAWDPNGLCNPGKLLPTPRLCGERPGKYRPHPLEQAGVIERL